MRSRHFAACHRSQDLSVSLRAVVLFSFVIAADSCRKRGPVTRDSDGAPVQARGMVQTIRETGNVAHDSEDAGPQGGELPNSIREYVALLDQHNHCNNDRDCLPHTAFGGCQFVYVNRSSDISVLDQSWERIAQGASMPLCLPKSGPARCEAKRCVDAAFGERFAYCPICEAALGKASPR